MKNTLGDLNNHIFAQLERLDDESLTDEELNKELERAEGVTKIANTIINNGKLVLDAQKFKDNQFSADAVTPKMLEG